MTIQSLRQYLSAIEAQSTLQNTTANTTNNNTSTTTTDNSNYDTYTSTIGDSSEVLSSEMYSNIMELIKANKQANGEEPNAPTTEDFQTAWEQYTVNATDTTTEETAEETSSTDSTQSSTSGSEDSSTSEEVKEYVVGPDGTIYLKTTTTDEEGNETVTMTKIADRPKHRGMTPPPMMGFPEDSNEQSVDGSTEEESEEA